VVGQGSCGKEGGISSFMLEGQEEDVAVVLGGG
jgi:hypothetical protein